MEKDKKTRRKIQEELCRILEKDLRNDPTCPQCILAGMDVLRAADELRKEVVNLCGVADCFVHAENVGALRELEQYVKLVTTGIRQYLAEIREGTFASAAGGRESEQKGVAAVAEREEAGATDA